MTCPAGIADAQEAAPRAPVLTAAEFLDKVERSSPTLELLESDVALASANVTSAGLRPNPSVAYEREELFAGAGSLPENVVRVEVPLDISGRRGLRIEAAKLGVDAARQLADRDKRGLLLDVLAVYLQAAGARLELEALLEERGALGRLVDAVAARAAAGDASGYDLDRLAIEADALDDRIADAERQLRVYRRALGVLAGAPGARFEAGDALTLPVLVSAPPGAAVPASHAARRAAELRVQQADLELRAAGRARVPALGVSGGAKNAIVDSDLRWGYVAGVSLSLPLLDHGQADADGARARLRSARAEQRRVEQQVSSQADASVEAFTLLVDQTRRYESDQLPRFDQLVRRAEASYQEGERPVFELLDAYRTARAGRLRAIELRLKCRLAEVEVWRARGLGPGGKL